MTDHVFLSAWLATLLFLASRLRLSERLRPWQQRLNRAGVVVLWFHIVLAYRLHHDDSHAAAVEHVAERTEEMIGIRSGAGIYANFLVALVWMVIAFTPTQRPDRPVARQRVALRLAAEVFLWLMFLCSAVVFAKPISAVVFLLLMVAVGASWARSSRNKP